jgi:hypothetical protein
VGNILYFEPRKRGKASRRSGASADVIIFSGIRYERLPKASAKMRTRRKSKQPIAVNPPAAPRSL